jgi:hypothetical protein
VTSFEVDRDIVASFPVTVTPDSIKADITYLATVIKSFGVSRAAVTSFLVATDTSKVDHQLTSYQDLVATASSEVVQAAA